MTYELKHIHGIPYYINGTTVYTFEMDAGKSSSKCIAIGTYKDESITYYDDWRIRVQPNLDLFRSSITSKERDKLRESIIKPQKQRKTTRTPRKNIKPKNTENT